MGEVRELYVGEDRPYKERSELVTKMERSAGIMAQHFADDLAGYVMLAVNAKGEWSLGFHFDKDSPIGPNMLAGITMAAVQRDIIAEGAIKDSLVRHNLVLPDPEQK